MVNVTLPDLNKSVEQLSPYLKPIKTISEFVKDLIAKIGLQYTNTLSTILTICVGLILIIIATRISNKIAKFLLIIFGVILLIGTAMLLFS